MCASHINDGYVNMHQNVRQRVYEQHFFVEQYYLTADFITALHDALRSPIKMQGVWVEKRYRMGKCRISARPPHSSNFVSVDRTCVAFRSNFCHDSCGWAML